MSGFRPTCSRLWFQCQARLRLVGTAVGLCMSGLRPVCEIQFDSFSYPAMNQIVTHVSRYRWRTHGAVGMPMVIRMPCGGGDTCLANFDLKRLPVKAGRQLKALVDGGFLDRKENLLLFGNPGAGKSHLLCALAHELIAQGRRMKYTSCALIVQDLLVAKRDLRLSKEIKKLARYDGLIIDEMGYVQQSREEMEVLFTLLAERYERGSVLLTSNLPFSKWEGIFKDPMTTAAAIDRLVHHSVILELNIPSYRMEEAKKTRDPAPDRSEAN